MTPLLASTLGAFLTTCDIYPCWIFAFGPYIEQLRGNVNPATALRRCRDRGVVLNLAVWFALHVFSRAPV